MCYPMLLSTFLNISDFSSKICKITKYCVHGRLTYIHLLQVALIPALFWGRDSSRPILQIPISILKNRTMNSILVVSPFFYISIRKGMHHHLSMIARESTSSRCLVTCFSALSYDGIHRLLVSLAAGQTNSRDRQVSTAALPKKTKKPRTILHIAIMSLQLPNRAKANSSNTPMKAVILVISGGGAVCG